MNFIDNILNKWEQLLSKAQPEIQKVSHFMKELRTAFMAIWKVVYRLRKFFAAIPIAFGAVYLAIYNQSHLPAVVGLNLQNNGEFAIQLVRELAVLAPLGVTAVCLLLMFASRRMLTPWLVSLFSLALPVMILITNTFPA